jgi:hypothetical protein
VIDKLKSGIQQWQENQGEVEWWQDEWGDPPDLIGQMVQEAFEEQTELGWGQALRGLLSMKWRTAMVMYYQEVDEHRREAVPMGEKWMVNTVCSHNVKLRRNYVVCKVVALDLDDCLAYLRLPSPARQDSSFLAFNSCG